MKRIAITGLGLVTPLGSTSATSWSALLNGNRGGRRLSADEVGTRHPRMPKGSHWFGAAVDRPPSPAGRLIPFAEQAAREAVRQAELDDERLRSAACVIGTSKPEMAVIDADPGDVAPWFPGAAAARVAALFGCEGGMLTPVAACATGLTSIIRGADLIREGACTTVLAGSTDASLHAGLLASYQRLGVLADCGDDPAGCCRPFDRTRSGFLVGEGAGILVLEDWDQARRRDAVILAEWIDGMTGSDPTGMTLVDATGDTLARLVLRLLRRQDALSPERLAVSVHGTATTLNDLAEGRAVRRLLPEPARESRCFGIKGAIGHLMGGAGSVELGFGVLALRDRVLPPSANHGLFDEACGLGLTRTAQDTSADHLLKLSLGFGGHLAAALIRRV